MEHLGIICFQMMKEVAITLIGVDRVREWSEEKGEFSYMQSNTTIRLDYLHSIDPLIFVVEKKK